MKVVIATHNKAKFERYKKILGETSYIEFVSLSDVHISQKVDEPFEAAMENAVYKAKKYAELSGFPTLVMDEATTTNFLPDHEQPGVYVRRFADKNSKMTDKESLTMWKQIFEKYPQNDKKFVWDFSIAFFDPKTTVLKTAQAVQRATVAYQFSSTHILGYPMSSFMILDGTTRPHAELSEDEKLKADKKIFHDFIQQFERWVKEL